MKTLIDTIHREAASRFITYLEEQKKIGQPLCHLESASFKSGFADYGDPAHVCLYLMRYGAAYIAEFYLILKKIIDSGFLDGEKISMLSVGAGANLDGLGAWLAIRDSGKRQRLTYQGIERAKWVLQLTDDANFIRIQKDIADVEVPDLKYSRALNLVSFPKILSEIDAETVSDFVSRVIIPCARARICILFSNRNANNSAEREMEREAGMAIVHQLQSESEYSLVDEEHLCHADSDFPVYIKEMPEIPITGAFVDREIIALADDPGTHCCQQDGCAKRSWHEAQNGYITNECRESIGRYPIIKTHYFDSHAYFLEKA